MSWIDLVNMCMRSKVASKNSPNLKYERKSLRTNTENMTVVLEMLISQLTGTLLIFEIWFLENPLQRKKFKNWKLQVQRKMRTWFLKSKRLSNRTSIIRRSLLNTKSKSDFFSKLIRRKRCKSEVFRSNTNEVKHLSEKYH